jgi:hypothetical protein
MSNWYILDENHKPVKCNDHFERHKWIQSLPEDQQTGIGCIVDKWEADGVFVSTVFLGLDHGWDSDVPIVFETMIFGGERDQECERYATWEEAKAGHARIVAEVQG